VPAAVEGLAAIASNLKHYDSINRVYGLPRQMLQALRVHYTALAELEHALSRATRPMFHYATLLT
jgi:hypothetical protein